MTARKSVKARRRLCRIVGVITTKSELRLAIRMAHPPDLFELRLDHLVAIANKLESEISRLRVPIVITARHPAEGGANNLSLQRRRELPTRMTQGVQVFIQDRLIRRGPWPMKLTQCWPFLPRIPARLIGIGFRPEHVRTRDFQVDR